MFHFAAVILAFLAGIVAAISGFGIGSLLTPFLAFNHDIRIAIALVAIPHALATALRFGFIYRNLDRSVFMRFGLASAAGGLFGAWLHSLLQGTWLNLVLGLLLLLAGTTGLSQKPWKLSGAASIWGGIFSGIFGGLVGNQGGIRAAALLNLDLRKEVFVAVSTASALLVDAARLPFYIYSNGSDMASEWPLIALLCISVTAGTFSGMHLLKKINQAYFKKTISILLILLGIGMLIKGLFLRG